MKIINYKFLSCQINHGTEENPDIEQIFLDKQICCTSDNLKANEEIAKREAYNGEYTIEDDGQPEQISTPTTEERVEALEAAVTMLCMPDASEV